MLILAIDTATKVCAVGLCQDGNILAEYKIEMGMTHSEGLMPQLEQLLQRTKIEKKMIDLIAVSMGPGSFTGLRIGLASAEALAYAWQKPLQGVNTLQALAYNIPIRGMILSPLLDAQKGNYYQAIYEWKNDKLHEHQAVQVVTQEEVFENLAKFGTPTLLLGECSKFTQITMPSWCELAPLQLRMPQASSVGLLAAVEHEQQAESSIFGLEPYYIRRSEAEELWEKKQQCK